MRIMILPRLVLKIRSGYDLFLTILKPIYTKTGIQPPPPPHKRSLLDSCFVSVVVIQSSKQCQQSFPCCTVCLVWLALGAREIPYDPPPLSVRCGLARTCLVDMKISSRLFKEDFNDNLKKKIPSFDNSFFNWVT